MSDVWIVMKKIFAYYPVNYSIVTALRIFGYAGLGILSGVTIKRFFDHASSSTLTSGIVYEICALLIVIPLVQAFTYYIDLSLSYGWTEIIRSIFRRNLFRFVLERPGAAMLPVTHGKLMNMLRSDVSAPESLMWDIPYFLAYAIFSLCGFVLLTVIDWRLTVALFIPLLLAIAAMRWLKRSITRHYERQQQTSDALIGMLGEMFRHQETVRLNNAVPSFMNRLHTITEQRAEAGKRSAVFDTALASVYDNIVNVSTALLLLLIGDSMRSGTFSTGSFTLFLYFLGYVSGTIRLFGATAASFRKSEAALSRMRELLGNGHVAALTRNDPLYLNEEPPVIERRKQAETLERVELRGIGYLYPGTDAGIRDISFTMPRGTITVVTGTVGAGKTTLLRTLLGLLPRQTGELLWNGRSVDSAESFFVPPAAAYVPQIPVLFSGTLRDNIGLDCPNDDDAWRAILNVSVLEEDVARFPDGLDTMLGPKGTRLSGGQLQRVAVARMAACQAELWVLDDISSALDAETEMRMWQRIDALRQSRGITCLVVSTKRFVLPFADQVIVLNNGRIDSAASRLLT